MFETASNLVLLQPGGSGAPFFLIHGLGGGIEDYQELARLLGPERAVYGLRARGQRDGREPHATIAEMADYDILLMRSVQPHGPYCLGGYSFGGFVAFEIACRLEKMGEKVGLVAIIEAAVLSLQRRPRSFWRPLRLLKFAANLPLWAGDFLRLDRSEMRTVIVRRAKFIRNEVASRLHWRYRMTSLDVIGEPAYDYPPEIQRILELHLHAGSAYHPEIFAGKVTLFRVRASPLFADMERDSGWGKAAQGGVEVVLTDGSHHTLLRQPYVRKLGKLLKDRLDSACP